MNSRITMKAAALTAVLILMAAAVPLFAQTETDSFDGEPPFVRELALRLMERDWSMEQVREMVQASRAFQWSGLDPELADLTAYALQKGLEGEPAGSVDSPRIRAQLALELAAAAGEMERLGYDEQLVARAAAESVRSMNTARNEWRTGENDEADALRIRDRVREQLRTEIEHQELRQQLRQRKGDGSGAGAGQSAGGGRDSAPQAPIGP